jgi:hypothetical protein
MNIKDKIKLLEKEVEKYYYNMTGNIENIKQIEYLILILKDKQGNNE